jgi:hypothetical protein
MEQLLISNAVDQALDKFDFSTLHGRTVYIDDKYLDCVDKGYLLASIRERALCNGARIAPKIDESDVALEVRSGAIGTDNSETFVGIPNMSVPGILPLEVPEVKIWNRTRHMGTAKIGILAYDTKSGTLFNHGGQALARSDDSNWFMFGVGPFQNGSVRTEVSEGTAQSHALARHVPHQPPELISYRPEFPVQPQAEPSAPVSSVPSDRMPTRAPATQQPLPPAYQIPPHAVGEGAQWTR